MLYCIPQTDSTVAQQLGGDREHLNACRAGLLHNAYRIGSFCTHLQ